MMPAWAWCLWLGVLSVCGIILIIYAIKVGIIDAGKV